MYRLFLLFNGSTWDCLNKEMHLANQSFLFPFSWKIFCILWFHIHDIESPKFLISVQFHVSLNSCILAHFIVTVYQDEYFVIKLPYTMIMCECFCEYLLYIALDNIYNEQFFKRQFKGCISIQTVTFVVIGSFPCAQLFIMRLEKNSPIQAM